MNAVTLELLDRKIGELTHERDVLARKLEDAVSRASKEQCRIDGWFVVWEPPPGFDVREACRRLQAHADATGTLAEMRFNDTKVVARPGGQAEGVWAQWKRARGEP